MDRLEKINEKEIMPEMQSRKTTLHVWYEKEQILLQEWRNQSILLLSVLVQGLS